MTESAISVRKKHIKKSRKDTPNITNVVLQTTVSGKCFEESPPLVLPVPVKKLGMKIVVLEWERCAKCAGIFLVVRLDPALQAAQCTVHCKLHSFLYCHSGRNMYKIYRKKEGKQDHNQ